MALALLMGLVLSAPGRALAGPISIGTDLFTTPDGTAFIDLTGSDLGLGIVDLNGNPIPGEPGGADTIVERLTGLGAGETGTIDIELVALSLVSAAPVENGGSFFDVFVTLDDSQDSPGVMTILTHDDVAGGGTWESFFDVFVKLTFVDIDTGLSNTFFAQDRIDPPAIPNQWIHSGNDNFLPVGVTRHEGPHPETVSVPAPPALLLFLAGLAGLGLMMRRRRRQA